MSVTALHGFLGSPSDWDGFHSLKIDHTPEWLPILAESRDLAEVAQTLNSQSDGGCLIGYSMGGRIALHMLIAERTWRKAVIVSASPGLADESVRRARTASDEGWASRFRSESWDPLIDAWNAQPVFGGRVRHAPRRPEAGFCREHLALALERGSVGRQADLRSELAGLDASVLWIAGGRDAKYAALAEECAALNPRFRFRILSQAGHRAPWDAPASFCREAMRFFGE